MAPFGGRLERHIQAGPAGVDAPDVPPTTTGPRDRRLTAGRWPAAPERPPIVVRWFLRSLLVIWLGFVVSAAVYGPSVTGSAPATLCYEAVILGSMLATLLRAVLVRAERATWAAIAVSMLLSFTGDMMGLLAPAEPFPGPPDLVYLCSYPCLYTGLVLLLRARLRRPQAATWLDGVVSAFAISAVVSAVAFDRIAAAVGGSRAAVLVGLAYPSADLVLLGVTAGALAMLGGRADRRWWLLSVSFALCAIVDTLYLFQAAGGTYQPGGLTDALWPASTLIAAVAAWWPVRQLRSGRNGGWRTLIVAVASTLTAIAVLDLAASRPVSGVAVALATLTLLAGAVRFGLTLHQVARLADSRRQAFTDDLTGLANRRALFHALTEAASTGRTAIGLLLVDLDRFKEINDSLGHQVGDELLHQLAIRLRSVTRPGDLLARLGGDEFALLLGASTPSIPVDRDTALRAAQRICDALAEPFALDDVTLHAPASVGIALVPDDTADPLQLPQRADVAMYAAKGTGNRIGCYRAGDDPHSKERLQTVEQLRLALRSDQLVCHYQPKVCLRTGGIGGVEALVRWQHPVRGLLAPNDFIPLAETAGLMRELTSCVLEAAIRQARSWHVQGLPLAVAINLSATNLLDEDLPEQVGRLLAGLDLPPSSLQLEITESVLMSDSNRAKDILQRLHRLGIQLAVDDYGTGYSSLAYLQDLPVDELKLDRAFIVRLRHDLRTAAIVRSSIDLGHSLGLRVVAEGVEDAETMLTLARFGCDVAQGFQISPALPVDRLMPWLAEWDPTRIVTRSGEPAEPLGHSGPVPPQPTRAHPPNHPADHSVSNSADYSAQTEVRQVLAVTTNPGDGPSAAPTATSQS